MADAARVSSRANARRDLYDFTGLRPELDPLIGRDTELSTVLDQLQNSRLVTLTGPGGSGKTRLAAAAVAAINDRGHPACMVDLSPVEDRALVPAAMMPALHLEGVAGRDPIDIVVDALGASPTILALDNVEQIQGIGHFASDLLQAAPSARILATSRFPLGVRGEVEYAIPPLALPVGRTAESVQQSPAGTLFLARARALGRLDDLDASTAREIAELLSRLDGLPLAIELAAARTRAMTPSEILHQMDEHGVRAVDGRADDQHRSLVAILSWTLGLLDPSDRLAIDGLAVCSGFGISMAQAIVPDVDITRAIESLVALGLVVPAGRTYAASRFRLLEMIRATVLRDIPSGVLADLRDRHADYCLELASGWFEQSQQRAALNLVTQYDVEADNMRRALDRFAVSDTRRAFALWTQLIDFWNTRGRVSEGATAFEELSERSEQPSVEYARALAMYPNLVSEMSGMAKHRDAIQRAIEMAESLDDEFALVMALENKAILAFNSADATAGAEVDRELGAIKSLDLSPRMRINLAESKAIAAVAMHGTESDEAVELQRAILKLATPEDWPVKHAYAAGNLAQSLMARGDYREAAKLAGAAVRVFRELERPNDVGWMLCYRAAALAELGDRDGALSEALEGASIAIAMGFHEGIFESLLTLMSVALVCGRPLEAARLWGAVEAMRERSDFDLPDSDRRLGERWLARATKSASRVAIDLAIKEGMSADPSELLSALPGSLRGSLDDTPVVRLRHGELTKREIEILQLVGQGNTDIEIGQAKFISPKTASVHVSNAKAKLGVATRLEAALWAREHGVVDGSSS